mgnify:CR=1 FL=1
MPTKDANNFNYRRLEKDNQFTKEQVIFFFFFLKIPSIQINNSTFCFKFKMPKPKVPVKSILTALFMFLAGSIMIIIATLLFTGHIDVQVSDS